MTGEGFGPPLSGIMARPLISFREFLRSPKPPPPPVADAVRLYAPSSGGMRTITSEGVDAPVAGAGVLPDPTDDGDVLTVVEGEWAGAPGGGSQPGAARVIGPFTFDASAAGANDGVEWFTPVIGDVFLDMWWRVTENGGSVTGPAFMDVGTINPDDMFHGIFQNFGGNAIDLTGAGGSGPFSGLDIQPGGLPEAWWQDAARGNGQLPFAAFSSDEEWYLWASKDGALGGDPIEPTAYTWDFWVMVATPAPLP